jgi:hypothetical protein
MEPASDHGVETAGEGLPPGLPSVHRFRCHIKALDELSLPAYPGSALRGLIGFGLRRTVCVTGQTQCTGCPLTASCAYHRFFEDSRPQGEEGRQGQVGPHPYVLDLHHVPGPLVKPGESYVFGLNLIGGARHLLPYLVVGINRAGQRGLGPRNARFLLVRVEQEGHLGREDWFTVGSEDSASVLSTETRQAVGGPADGPVTVELRTPLRLKRDGRLVGGREFTPALFMDALQLRLADLARNYGEGAGVEDGLPGREHPSPAAFGEPEVTWKEWTRFSTRQRARMQMGGLVGRFSADLDRLGPWARLLWFGQWLHLGKATTMGLGGYRLVPAASL